MPRPPDKIAENIALTARELLEAPEADRPAMLHRHMTTKQLVRAAARLANLKWGGDRGGNQHGKTAPGNLA